MTVELRLVVAEMRAAELLTTLQSALNGDAHWRLQAANLLGEINDCVLPKHTTEALREIDARKRAAEMMMDLCDE